MVGNPAPSTERDEVIQRREVIAPAVSAAEPRFKGTLQAVTEILRRNAVPMSVREIVEQGGTALPTRSRTPMTVVARDLAMDIKNKGEASAFVRTAPGRYTLRELLVRRAAPISDAPAAVTYS